jgi:hypothetical protein
MAPAMGAMGALTSPPPAHEYSENLDLTGSQHQDTLIHVIKTLPGHVILEARHF